jgi:UDPglucose 6-dehydrogenase
MDISVVGAGHVGLPIGIGLSSKGHKICFVDKEDDKVAAINNSESPIYEKDLSEKIEQFSDKIEATTDLEKAIDNSKITLIAVDTPTDSDGSIDLEDIKKCVRDVGKALRSKKGYHLVVIKSTIIPTTTEKELIPILEKESQKSVGKDFGVCMNPEFLREGTALDDFLKPDRIVIGEYDSRSGDKLEKLYQGFETPIVRTSLKTAEMIKYASNSLLATKISFINEIGNLCKKLGIDTYEVADGVGLDHRLNREFLNAGCGFGGNCFSKDVSAIKSLAEKNNLKPKILESVIEVNENQKRKMVDMLKQKIGSLENRKIAVLGLSFKPGTSDVRNSPAITLIGELKAEGAKIIAYDPKATENMKQIYPDIEYAETALDALTNVDGALIVTDWPEFEQLNTNDLPEPTIEGRKMDKTEGICW